MKDIVNESVEKLGRAIERFPWSDRAAYADWISQTYWYVRHSTRLLAVAAGRMPFDVLGDQLHHRFAAHIDEEQKHEKLCTHDLRVLGMSLSPENPSTRAFWEPQYYKVEHEHPASLMGYILVLEAVASIKGPWIHERVVKAHGEKAGQFVKLHAEEDIDHLEKAYKAVESLDLETRKLVEMNIRQTTDSYVRMLEECAEPKITITQRGVLALA